MKQNNELILLSLRLIIILNLQLAIPILYFISQQRHILANKIASQKLNRLLKIPSKRLKINFLLCHCYLFSIYSETGVFTKLFRYIFFCFSSYMSLSLCRINSYTLSNESSYIAIPQLNWIR